MSHPTPEHKPAGGFSPAALVTAVLAVGGIIAFGLGAYDVLTHQTPAGYVFLFGGSFSLAAAQVLHHLRVGGRSL
ncbi:MULTISPECIES: hypothetical protein [Brachybacterium]|uniref:Uncharacterized protein n=1 Tax=Brachybacterium kimchii TaxID=2942909 RepID=A0ABY4N8Y0_9MICO|nr:MULTISPECIES: hypothetical protein [Brachybacterium]MCG7309709.1 hypothetical protein [Brachybacterium sp. ACRRE]UQN30556.1 hypothetical protein M4486_04385 [Brachybacterium kimchii]